MGHGSIGKQIQQKPLGWLTPGNLQTSLVLPKQNPYALWEEVRSPYYTWEVTEKFGVDFSPYRKRQAHSWDCLCSRTWVYLVGNAEGWGDPVCAPRRFNLGGENNLWCNLYVAEVKQQKWHELMQDKFSEEQGEWNAQGQCWCPIIKCTASPAPSTHPDGIESKSWPGFGHL